MTDVLRKVGGQIWSIRATVSRFFIFLIIPIGLAAVVIQWGNGSYEFWDWSSESWQAFATSVTGYSIAVFAFLTWQIQNQQRQIIEMESEQLKLERQTTITNTLLAEALAINALEEAWIAVGPGSDQITLSQNRFLSVVPDDRFIGFIGLRKVEIRAVLDEAIWNTPYEQSYGVIESRRTWIIRDSVIKKDWNLEPKLSYSGGLANTERAFRPAIMSSRGMHELRGWIERVPNAYGSGMLSENGLEILSPTLIAVAGEDRADVLSPKLSNEAVFRLRSIMAYLNGKSGSSNERPAEDNST